MSTQDIDQWVRQLIPSLGGVKEPVNPHVLHALYRLGDYTAMVQTVAKQLKLPLRLRVGYYRSGGPVPETHPAWVRIPGNLPPYGTSEFKKTCIEVALRTQFLAEASFRATVRAIAHELSHIVLDAIGHPLRDTEEAVDLTAMILGYRDFYTHADDQPKVIRPPWWKQFLGTAHSDDVTIITEKWEASYLPFPVRVYAASLMHTTAAST